MNLLTKTSLLITTVVLFILMMGGIVFFELTKNLINKQVDKELISEMHTVMRSFDQLVMGNDTIRLEKVTIIPAREQVPFGMIFKDTIRYNDFEREFHTYRVLLFGYKLGNRYFKVEIYKSLIDSNILIEQVTLVWIGLSVVLINAIFFLNKIIFRRTWKDFFRTLHLAESYDIKNPEKRIVLTDSEINEFKSLNQVLSRLLERVEHDYRSQKELTANTSHELQTPLAIIRSKAELLIQTSGLSTEQFQLITDILNTTVRLSKLNRSLLIISRIDNNQFQETKEIDVPALVKSHIQQFQDFIDERGHQVVASLGSHGKIIINPLLFDLLLVNLLSNAIVHNLRSNGKIVITYHGPVLTIANTGPSHALQKNKIFQRYYRKTDNPDSTGIGLSIVNRICEYYDIVITYLYQDKMHSFSLDLSVIMINKGAGIK